MSDVLIQGFIDYEPTSITHQSALRIIQRTSWNKFIQERFKGRVGPKGIFLNADSLKSMLADWQKNLFVSAGASSELKKLKWMYLQHMAKIRPEEPFDGFLELKAVITFPWLKSASNKTKRECLHMLKNTKPDVDNYMKVLQDSFEQGGIVANDSRFARLIGEKRYGDRTGVYFRIRRLEPKTYRVDADILD